MSLKICIPAIAAFLLVACGGDGNKASDPEPSAEADFVVDTFDDLSVCIDKREGATAYVKDEEKDYICTDGGWIVDTNADTRKKSSSSKDEAKSSSSRCEDCKDDAKSNGSSAKSSSSNPVILLTPCKTETEDNCEYGVLVDNRDGQTYKTVKIGDQWWMAENLNYDNGRYTWCYDDSGYCAKSWCYNDSVQYCAKYGRLYLWSDAVDVCPEGWRLPNRADWDTLYNAAGERVIWSKMLKSQTGWSNDGNGLDAYGFSALPAGYRDTVVSVYSVTLFHNEGYQTYFWNAGSSFIYTAYSGSRYSNSTSLYFNDEISFVDHQRNPTYAFSVRCVKDEAAFSSSSAKSLSSDQSSSSVTLAIPCKTETEDNCEYGELVDNRDGQTYKTVKIGDQVWMAENLNYETANSWCGGGLDSTEGDCSKYGRLYTWGESIAVCPPGWHLPDTTEWNKLFAAVGGKSTAGKMLKLQTGWNDFNGTGGNGTDAYGFSAFPAGFRLKDGYFYREGYGAYFWSASAEDGDNAFIMILSDNENAHQSFGSTGDAFSVRCIQD